MIEYVEIRNLEKNVIGIIDTANSVIWRSVFFGVGDFEIEVTATPETVSLLQTGFYVTRIDNDQVGLIEKIYLHRSVEGGAVITASGRFVKSILDRRIIYTLSGTTNKATVLRGNVENAVREVVKNNAIACPFDSKRNIADIALGKLANIPLIIVDENGNAAEKQVTNENLMSYTDGVLEEYGLGAKCILQDGKFLYTIYTGVDRSTNNTAGNIPVIFSEEYDNLISSEYTYDEMPERNVALIGGEGEGVERFYSLLAKNESGLHRREKWIDAASIKKTLNESEIQELFPTGYYISVDFVVNGATYATLVMSESDNEKQYAIKTLKEKFPTGNFSGTKFVVNGETYANEIYGDDGNYKLTPLGFREMLYIENQEGNYMLTDAVYSALLKTKGKQDITPLIIEETFDGVLDGTNGNYVYGRDFALGDIVTVQDNKLGKYINVRIREVLECQDGNGYAVEIKYQ